jgi:anti-sigma factor RsiW
MSYEYTCGNDGALAAYLYNECEPGERKAIEAHLALCATCANEVAALQSTRAQLAEWTPPAAELGFRIVQENSVQEDRASKKSRAGVAWWQQPLPAWAQMAAAALVFATGAALGALWQPAGAPRSPVVASAPVAAPDTDLARERGTVSTRDLAALEQRLSREMIAIRQTADAARVTTRAQDGPSPRAGGADAELLQRVRDLIAESEQRQQRELAFRLAQVVRDVDSQRRVDLARIERSVGQMEGATGAELADQRRAINLMRVSQRQP